MESSTTRIVLARRSSSGAHSGEAEAARSEPAFVPDPMLDQLVGTEHEGRHLVFEKHGSGDEVAEADRLNVAHQHGAHVMEGVDGKRAGAGAVTDENGLHVSGLGGDGGIRGSCQGCEGDDWDDNVLSPDLDPCGRTAFHTFQRIGAQPQQPLDRMRGQPEHPPLGLQQQQRLACRGEGHVQQNLGSVRIARPQQNASPAACARLPPPRKGPCRAPRVGRPRLRSRSPARRRGRAADPSSAGGCAGGCAAGAGRARWPPARSARRSGPRPSSRMLMARRPPREASSRVTSARSGLPSGDAFLR